MSLNIVITMAGRGSRFYDAGYTVPKYEIPAHGKSLFDWSMLSLKHFLSLDAKVIFICLKENHCAPYVRQRCEALGIHDFHIIELDGVTDGQATSAYIAREYWLPHNPLLIYNIDTFVEPEALKPINIRKGSDGWVPCFQANGDHWSFVKLDSNGWALDLTEKLRISKYATIGLYWFANAKYYEQAYIRFFSNNTNLVKGERYIAPLYRQMIADGMKVSITDLSLNDVHVLGTPSELDEFLSLSPEKFSR
jgi:dTDP-glucose pyrophosphorylase